MPDSVTFTAGSPGSVTIQVTDSASPPKQATVSFLVQIQISPTPDPWNMYKSLLNKPSTQQFVPIGGTAPYIWSFVQNNSSGTLSNNGLYTAGPNYATDIIQVTDAYSNTATKHINVCTVLSLAVSPTTYTLGIGAKTDGNPPGPPSNYPQPVVTASLGIGDTTYFTATWNANSSWSVNDPTSATVDNSGTTSAGIIQQIGLGDNTITATDVDSGNYCTIAIIPKTIIDGLQSIVVTPAPVYLNMGAKQQYVATGIYENNYPYNITSQSSWSFV